MPTATLAEMTDHFDRTLARARRLLDQQRLALIEAREWDEAQRADTQFALIAAIERGDVLHGGRLA